MRDRSLRSSASPAVATGRPAVPPFDGRGSCPARVPSATSAIACGDAACVPSSVGECGSASVASTSTAADSSASRRAGGTIDRARACACATLVDPDHRPRRWYRPRAMQGRHVVVTGGNGALGVAVVAVLESRGATVHVPDIATVDLSSEAAATAYYAGLPPLWASIQLAGGFSIA